MQIGQRLDLGSTAEAAFLALVARDEFFSTRKEVDGQMGNDWYTPDKLRSRRYA